MNEIFKKDYYAFYGETWRIRGGVKRLVSNRDIRYIYAGRMSTSAKTIFVRMLFRFIRHSMAVKRCAEISFQNVGAGLHLSHGTAIIITAKAKIGENCSLRNGITIGVELRGKRKGAPTIGDGVWIGPNHVVFIIRKDLEKEFKEVIGDRIASICASHDVTVDYAFQDINDIPGALPEGRTKPWGTGQAVLAAKDVIKTPFIVINADDYYGKEGFKAVHEYLVNGGKSCMSGFVLKNTLSDNGGVTRGICKMDEQNNLTEVVETKNIVKTADGAEADGVAVDVDSLVSMNMWGLTPDFRLGTFQLSDIFYNTVGGVLGGLLYYVAMKVRKRL